MRIVPLILAGGEGTRLRPLSNSFRPKQFLNLGEGDQSFFQSTLKRALSLAPAEDIITVSAQDYRTELLEQLCDIDARLCNHVILEPMQRNTAAAIAVGALYAKQRFGEQAVLWVMPSDHVIERPASLSRAVEGILPQVLEGVIATFGITPQTPTDQYGYIAKGEPRGTGFKVERFIEKPPLDQVQSMMDAGSCFINSGIFLFTVRTILAELAHYAPETLELAQRALIDPVTQHGCTTLATEHYISMPFLSIDRLVMEHSDRLVVQPVDIGWRDIGSWTSLWEWSQDLREGTPLERFLETLSQVA